MKLGLGKRVRCARYSCCSPYQWRFTFDIFLDFGARQEDDSYVVDFNICERSLDAHRESLTPDQILLPERILGFRVFLVQNRNGILGSYESHHLIPTSLGGNARSLLNSFTFVRKTTFHL
jgi:hypothetical protein